MGHEALDEASLSKSVLCLADYFGIAFGVSKTKQNALIVLQLKNNMKIKFTKLGLLSRHPDSKLAKLIGGDESALVDVVEVGPNHFYVHGNSALTRHLFTFLFADGFVMKTSDMDGEDFMSELAYYGFRLDHHFSYQTAHLLNYNDVHVWRWTWKYGRSLMKC